MLRTHVRVRELERTNELHLQDRALFEAGAGLSDFFFVRGSGTRGSFPPAGIKRSYRTHFRTRWWWCIVHYSPSLAASDAPSHPASATSNSPPVTQQRPRLRWPLFHERDDAAACFQRSARRYPWELATSERFVWSTSRDGSCCWYAPAPLQLLCSEHRFIISGGRDTRSIERTSHNLHRRC